MKGAAFNAYFAGVGWGEGGEVSCKSVYDNPATDMLINAPTVIVIVVVRLTSSLSSTTTTKSERRLTSNVLK